MPLPHPRIVAVAPHTMKGKDNRDQVVPGMPGTMQYCRCYWDRLYLPLATPNPPSFHPSMLLLVDNGCLPHLNCAIAGAREKAYMGLMSMAALMWSITLPSVVAGRARDSTSAFWTLMM